MRSIQFQRLASGWIVLILPFATPGSLQSQTATESDGPELHRLVRRANLSKSGPFVRLDDGRLLTVEGNAAHWSDDDGKTWTDSGRILAERDPRIAREWRALARTPSGAVVLVFMDLSTQRFEWNSETKEPSHDTRLEVWCARSLDGGATWIDQQPVERGYCGALFDMVVTGRGRLVVPVQGLERAPARHVMRTYTSDDQGKSWRASNTIDLNGHGHHDGAMEGTLVERRDGKLLMLLRTNLDQFWRAMSDDQGHSWRRLEPSGIDASSAPGFLTRLASGRLVLAWNRLYPEGMTATEWNQRPGGRRAGDYSEVSASWHREELSIAFSGDDGKRWSEPIVVARQREGSLAYPDIFEPSPGRLWISTRITSNSGGRVEDLRIELEEESFVTPPHPDLPVHSDIRLTLEQSEPAMRYVGTTAQECRDWQTAFRSQLAKLLGDFTPPRRWRVEEEGRTDFDDHTRLDVLLVADGVSSLPLYLLIPRRAAADSTNSAERRRAPAVLCVHGHGAYGHHPIVGRRDISGVGNDIDRMNYDYGLQFVRRGYVVAAPCMVPFGRRVDRQRYGGRDPCAVTFVRMQALGKVSIAANLRDLLWSIDFLVSRREVDPQRIGCAGLSYGGRMTMLAAALDDRIRVAAVSGALNLLQERVSLRYSCGSQIIPGLLKFGDYSEIGSLIAPRPCVWEVGSSDPLIIRDWDATFERRLRRAYVSLAAEESLRFDRFDGGHRWNGDVAFDLFEETLRP